MRGRHRASSPTCAPAPCPRPLSAPLSKMGRDEKNRHTSLISPRSWCAHQMWQVGPPTPLGYLLVRISGHCPGVTEQIFDLRIPCRRLWARDTVLVRLQVTRGVTRGRAAALASPAKLIAIRSSPRAATRKAAGRKARTAAWCEFGLVFRQRRLHVTSTPAQLECFWHDL